MVAGLQRGHFSPAVPGDLQGTIWQIPALGGAPRRIIDSIGGGDVGPNGRFAVFRLAGKQVELVSAAADGADVRVIARFTEAFYFNNRDGLPTGSGSPTSGAMASAGISSPSLSIEALRVS